MANYIIEVIFINNNILELKMKFEEIKRRGFIKSSNNDKIGGGGKTFEHLLGLKANYSTNPDYKGIEIKTKSLNSKYDLTLFSLIPKCDNNINSTEIINFLVENYGYIKAGVSSRKILYTYCFATYLNKGNGNFYFFLNVDKNSQRIWLYVFNEKLRIRSKMFYWEFNDLKTCLNKKLKYLAYVNVNNKKVNGLYFYKYTNIEFFYIKNFDTFIKQIENGNIFVCFNIGRYKNKDKISYHGIRFVIREEKINRLYNKIAIKELENK